MIQLPAEAVCNTRKQPSPAANYLHQMQIIFTFCLFLFFGHVRMHSLALQRAYKSTAKTGQIVKTTTQQQMTTERSALGLSLLAGSWCDTPLSITAAAPARTSTAAWHRRPASLVQLLAALCPASLNRHHFRNLQLAKHFFGSCDCQAVHHIRGGNP
jgi:hypothetical protein